MIRDEMMAHLKKYNLIKESKHGFVQKRSYTTNLFEVLEHVTNFVDQGYPIYMFHKAFNMVPHMILILKLTWT
jgi:hypothetical protein